MIEGYQEGKVTIMSIRRVLKMELENIPPIDEEHDEEKQQIIDELDCIDANSEAYEMDSILADLYDWGDEPLDNRVIGGKKVCWIG
jgi:hypothetical protein